ncbi:FRG domain-containing protein [bacterium]|nr:FRG domain-containing protein [bacterium]
MAILYDENNSKIFSILHTKENEYCSLQDAKSYFLTLNDESYAFSEISAYGCYSERNKYDGFFISNNPHEFGIIAGHEFSPFIYRGQNKDYPTFIPTANRYNLSQKEQLIKRCIDWVKKQEFLQLFQSTPYFIRCQNFQVLNCKFKFDLEAIAQHYEFMSNYIDITRDLFVALFFAYTYQKDGIYYPIQDFSKYSPMLYVGNLKKIYTEHPNSLKIIGFQSLLRPHLQKAMAIEILVKDTFKPLFEKVELPKNYAFACEIFNKANAGLNLFPNDSMSQIAKQIKENKFLSLESVREYCNNYNLNFEEIKIELQNQSYNLTNENWGIPYNLYNAINDEIDRHIIPYLNDRVAFRKISEPLRPANIAERNIL